MHNNFLCYYGSEVVTPVTTQLSPLERANVNHALWLLVFFNISDGPKFFL
jgi:hypothetical protein